MKTIESLLTLINRGEALSEQNVRYCISMVNEGSEEKLKPWQVTVFVLPQKASR